MSRPSTGEPVQIDRQARVIRVYEKHPDFEDRLKTSLGEFSLDYSKWDYRESPFPACEVRGGNVVRVNSRYPLFQSRAYGRFFLRIAVTLTVMTANSKKQRELARNILLEWAQEFRDLL